MSDRCPGRASDGPGLAFGGRWVFTLTCRPCAPPCSAAHHRPAAGGPLGALRKGRISGPRPTSSVLDGVMSSKIPVFKPCPRPAMTALDGGTRRRSFRSKKVGGRGDPEGTEAFLRRREQTPPSHSLSLSLSRCLPRAPPGTHSAKAMRDTSRGHHLQAGERPRQKPSLRTPRSWTSGLQSHGERSAVSAACLCSAGAAQAAAEPEFSNLAGGHPTVGEAWRAPRARALGYCPPPTVSHLPVGEETLTLSGSHLRP